MGLHQGGWSNNPGLVEMPDGKLVGWLHLKPATRTALPIMHTFKFSTGLGHTIHHKAVECN